MKKLQSVVLLIAILIFMLGGITIAQNLFDGNLIPTLIGIGFCFIGIILSAFVGITETAKYCQSVTVREKIRKAVYDYLVDKGYDTETAYRLATKVTRWS